MRKFLFGVLAISMLVACSQDEVTSFKREGISYSVATGKQTRAADSYCNNDLPRSFIVWAQNCNDNSLYIGGDKIMNIGTDDTPIWNDESGTRYWPDNTLNFFAHVNGETSFAYNNGAPTFNNFTVSDNVETQVDLLYAVKRELDKPIGTVNLNFRHALSQIVFRAQNTNPHLYIEISGVSVGHIGSTATFTYPDTDGTDGNFEEHSDNISNAVLPGQGTWTNAQESTLKQYDVVFDPVVVSSDVTNLTCPEKNHKNSFENVLTLLPQKADAWDPTQKGTEWNGSYFWVNCKIWNIAGSEIDKEKDRVLYEGNAAIPVTIDWKQGKRYIYTFVFSNGTGGYEPDPNDPKPVLTSIKYDLTVDDFIPVDGSDKPMDGDSEQGKKNTYKVIYHSNIPDYEQTTDISKETTEASCIFITSSQQFTYEGYTFTGWNTQTNGNGTAYAAGDALTLLSNSPTLDLYAIWEKNPEQHTYTLKFDAGEGATNVPETLIAKTTNESYTFNMPTDNPSKGNYRFVGWTLDKPENQNMNSKIIEDKTYELTQDSSEVTLYALWKTKTSGGSTPDSPGENPWE
ncbi:fimbrillin family protein [Bacteroides sp.]|uniref:fimbrillin family protein n=1 Tax=Bacteroides sp. TaxID=29523 RepID=UPI0026069544|nr:fimbrillin family protein [Bacteroides sp.]MDD3036783.1 fimbrillin family protein [Bacteroides sp.]